MRKQVKKLQLHRDTLSHLANDQETILRNAQGGALPETDRCTEWESICSCLTVYHCGP